MVANNDSKWKRSVAKVFDTRPRIATGKETIWLKRVDAMRGLDQAASRPGAHVCLDGPTGAGKTSLALSYLVEHQIRYVPVQVTKELDWKGFCRQLVIPTNNSETSLTGEFEIGFAEALPTARLKVVLGDRSRRADQLELSELQAQSWTEHDVARRLAEANALLFVDDAERASESLLRRLADLSRVLTQTHTAEHAKLLLVGSGDVYQRLYHENPALEGRLLQVSLGGFDQFWAGTALIIGGFDKLRLYHPWNSRFESERNQRAACKRAIWDAADGLPKSVNSLAYSLAVDAGHRRSVTASTIRSMAADMTQHNWVQYAQRFPEVVTHLYEQPLGRVVIAQLYKRGIARVHKVHSVFQGMQSRGLDVTQGQVDAAIDGLVSVDFLVRTGGSGELVFVKHPTAAHVLGVAMREPERFKRIAELQRGRQPLSDHFPIQDDDDNDDDTPYRSAYL